MIENYRDNFDVGVVLYLFSKAEVNDVCLYWLLKKHVIRRKRIDGFLNWNISFMIDHFQQNNWSFYDFLRLIIKYHSIRLKILTH